MIPLSHECRCDRRLVNTMGNVGPRRENEEEPERRWAAEKARRPERTIRRVNHDCLE